MFVTCWTCFLVEYPEQLFRRYLTRSCDTRAFNLHVRCSTKLFLLQKTLRQHRHHRLQLQLLQPDLRLQAGVSGDRGQTAQNHVTTVNVYVAEPAVNYRARARQLVINYAPN